MSIPAEIANQYNKLKTQYSQIFKRYIELQEERREAVLVLTNLQPLKGQRRCWKMVGGVLVQHSIEETKQSLKDSNTMIESTMKALDDQMTKRQKQVHELQSKYNISPTRS